MRIGVYVVSEGHGSHHVIEIDDKYGGEEDSEEFNKEIAHLIHKFYFAEIDQDADDLFLSEITTLGPWNIVRFEPSDRGEDILYL